MNDNANIHALPASSKSRDDKAVMFASGRLSDARKWFAHRGWDVLPQSDRGQSILRWGADHAWLAGRANPKRSVRNWCRRWAPWLSDTELRQIIAETEDSNKRWSHDQSAAVLEITVRDLEAHLFRFLGASDDPNYDRRNQTKRQKGAARSRKYRAENSTGRPCGRPRLDLTAQEKGDRERKQSAESSRRHRAANSTGAKRGRPKAEVPAWKAAGFNSKRTYQRHKALDAVAAECGTENPSGKKPSRHINNVGSVTEFSVTEFRCHSAERPKRDGDAPMLAQAALGASNASTPVPQSPQWR